MEIKNSFDTTPIDQESEQNLPLHIKARFEKGPGYPDRFPVPDELVKWIKEYPEYKPPYYVAPKVIENDDTVNEKGWADPEDFSSLDMHHLKSYYPNIEFDNLGRPLNPFGRTGIEGRGLLGRWGANFAADPIITKDNPVTGKKELLVILRKSGEWALPGGMVDKGERLSGAAARELKEEAGLDLDMSKAKKVYEGYVDDPRNTDNAWMETAAYHLHLTPEEAENSIVVAGDDATDVKWMPIDLENINTLYASHSDLVKQAVEVK